MPQNDSARVITAADVRRRYKDQVGQGYIDIANIAKSGVVVAAAISVLDLFKTFTGTALSERLFYLFVSLVLGLIPLVTYRRGVLLGTVRLSVMDYVAPLVMAGAEVMMVIVISRPNSEVLWGDFRVAWIFSVMIHSWAATALVWTRMRLSRFRGDFDQELHERGLYRQYIRWLYFDLYGSLGFGFLAFLAWQGDFFAFPIDTRPYVEPTHHAFAAIILGLMAAAVCFQTIYEHQRIRERLGDS